MLRKAVIVPFPTRLKTFIFIEKKYFPDAMKKVWIKLLDTLYLTPAAPAALWCHRSMVMTMRACVAPRTPLGDLSMVVACSEYSYYVLVSIRDLCPACRDTCPALSNVSRCPVNIRRICIWIHPLNHIKINQNHIHHVWQPVEPSQPTSVTGHENPSEITW